MTLANAITFVGKPFRHHYMAKSIYKKTIKTSIGPLMLLPVILYTPLLQPSGQLFSLSVPLQHVCGHSGQI
jgi:hypothetical protein